MLYEFVATSGRPALSETEMEGKWTEGGEVGETLGGEEGRETAARM